MRQNVVSIHLLDPVMSIGQFSIPNEFKLRIHNDDECNNKEP